MKFKFSKKALKIRKKPPSCFDGYYVLIKRQSNLDILSNFCGLPRKNREIASMFCGLFRNITCNTMLRNLDMKVCMHWT